MGGEYEGKVERDEAEDEAGFVVGRIGPRQQTMPPTDLPNIRGLTQEIRFHKNGTEIHFHVNAEGLKVSLPVSEWWKAFYQDLLSGREFHHIDPVNKARLVIRLGYNAESNIDLEARVERVEFGEIFQKLYDFTKQASPR